MSINLVPLLLGRVDAEKTKVYFMCFVRNGSIVAFSVAFMLNLKVQKS